MCNQKTTSSPSAKSNPEGELAKLGELVKLKEYVKETAELIKESYYTTVVSYLVFESTNLTTHEIDGWYASIRIKAEKLTHTVNTASVPGTYIENWRALFGAERWFVSACEDNLDITFLVKPQQTT